MATIDAHHMRDREMEGVAPLLPLLLPISKLDEFIVLDMFDMFDTPVEAGKLVAVEREDAPEDEER